MFPVFRVLLVGPFLITGMLATAVLGQTSSPTAKTAKKWNSPKTAWGEPDLQGTYTSDDAWGIPFERPKELGMRKELTDDELAAKAKRVDDTLTNVSKGERPTSALGARPPVQGVDGAPVPAFWGEFARRASRQTSLVIEPEDGHVPALTEEAKARAAATAVVRNRRAETYTDRSMYDRCITRGVTGSIFPVIYGNGSQIVQSPGYVALRVEMIHDTRVIPTDNSPHPNANLRTYLGDSRGRWEGNTLVVETTNFIGNHNAVGTNGSQGPPYSDELKLLEKFTRVAADRLHYQVTITDPKTYVAPWTVAFDITQEPGYQLFEYACHEGNYAMHNLLSAARAEDKAEIEKVNAGK